MNESSWASLSDNWFLLQIGRERKPPYQKAARKPTDLMRSLATRDSKNSLENEVADGEKISIIPITRQARCVRTKQGYDMRVLKTRAFNCEPSSQSQHSLQRHVRLRLHWLPIFSLVPIAAHVHLFQPEHSISSVCTTHTHMLKCNIP